MKLYIAFSIHGSESFITASRELHCGLQIPGSKMTIEGMDFTVVSSRRPEANALLEIKLHSALLTRKDGQPLRDPARILSAFKKFEEAGWTVDRSKFIHTHYLSKREAAAREEP